MNVKLLVVTLWADDVPALVHFYRDVIGLPLMVDHGDRPHFDLDGVYLTIIKGIPSPAADSEPEHFPLVAFSVEDLDAAVNRLQAYGVDMPWGISSGPDSRWTMFYDPARNLIELAEKRIE
jgi:predicted enzyme related to lactoylglutathione lyase